MTTSTSLLRSSLRLRWVFGQNISDFQCYDDDKFSAYYQTVGERDYASWAHVTLTYRSLELKSRIAAKTLHPFQLFAALEVLFFGLPEFEREDDGKNAEVWRLRDGLQIPVPRARRPFHQVQDCSDGGRHLGVGALLRVSGDFNTLFNTHVFLTQLVFIPDTYLKVFCPKVKESIIFRCFLLFIPIPIVFENSSKIWGSHSTTCDASGHSFNMRKCPWPGIELATEPQLKKPPKHLRLLGDCHRL